MTAFDRGAFVAIELTTKLGGFDSDLVHGATLAAPFAMTDSRSWP
jgi:hypothetical protein